MAGAQSRLLKAGARVCWRDDKTDQGTITETNWSGYPQMGQPQRAIHSAQRHLCHRARIQEMIAMKNLKTKTASAEIKCPCDGTRFPAVAQPAKPNRRIFPPA